MAWKLTLVWLAVCAAAGILFFFYSKTQMSTDPANRWKPTRETKLFGIVLLGFGAVIMYGVMSPPEPTVVVAERPTAAPPPPKKEDIEIRTVLAGAQALKESMKKPETFELLSATMIDGKVICYEYRARNSFNDRRTDFYVVSDSVSSSEPKHWNRLCAGKSGTDYTNVRAVLR